MPPRRSRQRASPRLHVPGAARRWVAPAASTETHAPAAPGSSPAAPAPAAAAAASASAAEAAVLNDVVSAAAPIAPVAPPTPPPQTSTAEQKMSGATSEAAGAPPSPSAVLPRPLMRMTRQRRMSRATAAEASAVQPTAAEPIETPALSTAPESAPSATPAAPEVVAEGKPSTTTAASEVEATAEPTPSASATATNSAAAAVDASPHPPSPVFPTASRQRRRSRSLRRGIISSPAKTEAIPASAPPSTTAAVETVAVETALVGAAAAPSQRRAAMTKLPQKTRRFFAELDDATEVAPPPTSSPPPPTKDPAAEAVKEATAVREAVTEEAEAQKVEANEAAAVETAATRKEEPLQPVQRLAGTTAASRRRLRGRHSLNGIPRRFQPPPQPWNASEAAAAGEKEAKMKEQTEPPQSMPGTTTTTTRPSTAPSPLRRMEISRKRMKKSASVAPPPLSQSPKGVSEAVAATVETTVVEVRDAAVETSRDVDLATAAAAPERMVSFASVQKAFKKLQRKCLKKSRQLRLQRLQRRRTAAAAKLSTPAEEMGLSPADAMPCPAVEKNVVEPPTADEAVAEIDREVEAEAGDASTAAAEPEKGEAAVEQLQEAPPVETAAVPETQVAEALPLTEVAGTAEEVSLSAADSASPEVVQESMEAVVEPPSPARRLAARRSIKKYSKLAAARRLKRNAVALKAAAPAPVAAAATVSTDVPLVQSTHEAAEPLVAPAEETAAETLQRTAALPLPSGSAVIEQFTKGEMILRRNSLDDSWDVGLSFDWQRRTLAISSFPTFDAADPRRQHPFVQLYLSQPRWLLEEVNEAKASRMREALEAMQRSLTARFVFRKGH